jgi:hypothetical protein
VRRIEPCAVSILSFAIERRQAGRHVARSESTHRAIGYPRRVNRFLRVFARCAVIGGVAFAAAPLPGCEGPERAPLVGHSELESLALRGLHYEEFAGGRVESFTVGRVSRRSLRAGPYSLNALQEYVLDSARLVLRPEPSTSVGPRALLDGMPLAASAGQLGEASIAGALRIDGLTIQVGEAGDWAVELLAERARADPWGDIWELRRASIATSSGQKLSAPRMRLVDRGRGIEVRGRFEYDDGDRRFESTRGRFELDPVAGELALVSLRGRAPQRLLGELMR